jgi:hypothetical protein
MSIFIRSGGLRKHLDELFVRLHIEQFGDGSGGVRLKIGALEERSVARGYFLAV